MNTALCYQYFLPTRFEILFIMFVSWIERGIKSLFILQQVDNASGYLRVAVTDSGVGFAAVDKAKVLKNFFQFKRSELEGGGTHIVD